MAVAGLACLGVARETAATSAAAGVPDERVAPSPQAGCGANDAGRSDVVDRRRLAASLMKLFRPHAPPDLPVDAPERLAELSDLVQAAEDAVEEIRRDGLDRKAHAFVDEIFAQGMARRIRIGAATGTWEEFERAAASRPWGERRVVLMTPDDGDEALEVVLRPSEHAG